MADTAKRSQDLRVSGEFQVERAERKLSEDAATRIGKEGHGACAAAFDAETDALRFLMRIPTHRPGSIADLAAERQVNAERAAFSRSALKVDRAAVLGNQFTDDRQAKPRAFRLRGEVRGEYLFQVLR